MITIRFIGSAAIISAFLAVHGAIVWAAPISPLPKIKSSALQFADLGGIAEWRAGGAKLIYIKDDKGQWYQVDLREACMELDTSKGVHFITEVGEGANRYSAVDVANRQCRVTTMKKIEAPRSQ